MNLNQNIVMEFDTNQLPDFKGIDNWHLTFIDPDIFDPDYKFNRASKTIDGKKVIIEYALVNIDRPWFDMSVFELIQSNEFFEAGSISDGAGNGFLGEINTALLIANYIKIGEEYENSNLQLLGWIVERMPMCPKE